MRERTKETKREIYCFLICVCRLPLLCHGFSRFICVYQNDTFSRALFESNEKPITNIKTVFLISVFVFFFWLLLHQMTQYCILILFCFDLVGLYAKIEVNYRFDVKCLRACFNMWFICENFQFRIPAPAHSTICAKSNGTNSKMNMLWDSNGCDCLLCYSSKSENKT